MPEVLPGKPQIRRALYVEGWLKFSSLEVENLRRQNFTVTDKYPIIHPYEFIDTDESVVDSRDSTSESSPSPAKRRCLKEGQDDYQTILQRRHSLENSEAVDPDAPKVEYKCRRINRLRFVLTKNTPKPKDESLKDIEENLELPKSQDTPEPLTIEDGPKDEEIIVLDEDSEPEFESLEIHDYIEIFDEDDLDEEYRKASRRDFYCEVCEKFFRSRQLFAVHHRRHIALEHFQCPTCLQGFVSLSLCTRHEVRVHNKKPICLRHLEMGSNVFERESSPGLASTSGASEISSKSSGSVEEEDVDEDDPLSFYSRDGSARIIPSNCLIGYRGPPSKHMVKAFKTELKHAPKNRGPGAVSRQIQSIKFDFRIIGDRCD